MKKIYAAIMTLTLMAAFAVPTFAQGRGNGRVYTTQSRVYNQRGAFNNRGYDYRGRSDRSFWDQHRDKLTLATGTAGGAILGALLGGGKGAAIGALAGAGGSALYTYKLRDDHHHRRF
jgi:hypothetical protein